MLKIRMATPDDLTQLSTLWYMMIKEVNQDATPNKEWWRAHVLSYMSVDVFRCIVAEVEDVIIGFIDGFLYADPESGKLTGICNHFFVMPEFRKNSTGYRLYKTIIKIAKEKKAEAIEAICYRKSLNFWQSKGMNPIKYHMRRAI